jgi:YHS domain-containing protein
MPKDPICGMAVKEASALRLVKEGETYYFCSEHCLRRFSKEHNISDKEVVSCLVHPKTKWYKNKVVITSAILGSLSLLSYSFPILEPFRKSLMMYLQTIWWAILLGLILGGIIEHFIPREYVSHILAKPRKRTIFYSVILGFFMSACSHGILALSIELHKKGASNPAVITFFF